MNIQLIAEQIGRIHLTLETQAAFEVYGGTWLGAFEVSQTGTAQWTLTVREKMVAAAPLRDYKIYARQIATGREWEVLSGKILVSARTAAVPADKLAPVEYFVTVPVVDHDVDAVGSTIVQGIPGPQGPKGDPGPPGEGGISDSERTLLLGAAQRGGDNTFTAANTFTGSVDMSTAQVTPPEGWNVEGVTAEQVQAVVPMAWGSYTKAPTVTANSYVFGDNAKANGVYSTAIGSLATAGVGAHAIGYDSNAGLYGFASGHTTRAGSYCVSIGNNAKAQQTTAIAIGSAYSDTAGSYSCTTEGTGSITIGAGANTLNYTATDGTIAESSNAITIGCKAENHNPDSIVIGASAKLNAPESYGSRSGSIVIGAEAQSQGVNGISIGRRANTYNAMDGIAIGTGARANANSVALGSNTDAGMGSTALGYHVKASQYTSVAVGSQAEAKAKTSSAFGVKANAADEGVCVFSSWMQYGNKTQLYFSGAGTPLANEYYNGEAMMGYTVTDSAGAVLACGTRRLSELFTDNTLTQPASLDENGEWVQPIVFHPSDLDMPTEEPSEPEEYTPLPVYPIVEPEVPEDLPPHAEVENS